MDKIEKLKNPKVYLNNDTAKALGVTFTDSLRAQTKR
jgi:hypothetical protein